MKKIFLLIILSVGMLSAQNSNLLRFPSINNDGSKIAFSFQGDIWTVPVSGGKAVRLTIHEAYESSPKWNNSGDKIAFSGSRFGNNDVFVVSADGGIPTRLTYNSANDAVAGWTAKDEVIFTTNRSFVQIEWDSEIHTIPAGGGTSKRILNAVGDMPAISPNGKLIAFVMGSCRISRETYEGPANREIWIWNSETDEYHKITDYNGNDIFPQWASDTKIYFLSPKSGRYNIYTIDIAANGAKSSEPTPITNYDDDGIRYLTLSLDGSTAVFEKGTDIYLMNTSDNNVERVDIEIAADYKFDPYERKTYSSSATDYAVSPNGEYSALEIHGEIYVKENDKDKSRTVNVSKHSFRDQQPLWLNDSTLIFTSDRNGQYDFYL
ncbi:MAG: peptidase S41, partial [Melioribacteraceae bacterium]|nr:peptidase S41 [Melioribacteraceae bacterium]